MEEHLPPNHVDGLTEAEIAAAMTRRPKHGNKARSAAKNVAPRKRARRKASHESRRRNRKAA